ncbi:ribokinase [Peptacetobacter sp.]|uniref:ribokinase n=1 Tax=Peptacetobacter sp. TaxID=2991975 RepID=UPI002E76AB58|nr:ribokinase [Peptacetobacter sp.]MEE0452336.1 ribokinase [Peptacetobacter sp.]
MSKILVVGSLNLDYVIEVENMPKAGETIFGKSLKKIPGGKGANQAYAIGKLGGDVAMIGAVGDDDAGQILLNNLKSVNVDTSGIEIVNDNVTGQAYIYVDDNGQNCITVISGANAVVDRDMIDRNMELIDDAEYVVMQLEVPIDTVKYVKDIAISKGKKVIIDPAPAIKNPDTNLWRGCYIIKPNELELATLTGKKLNNIEEYKKAAIELQKTGADFVISTLGRDGAIAYDGENIKKLDCKKTTVVDTTAAGDTFTAGLVIGLNEGKSIEEAINFGQSAAAITVSRKGAQTSIPSRDEIQ